MTGVALSSCEASEIVDSTVGTPDLQVTAGWRTLDPQAVELPLHLPGVSRRGGHLCELLDPSAMVPVASGGLLPMNAVPSALLLDDGRAAPLAYQWLGDPYLKPLRQ